MPLPVTKDLQDYLRLTTDAEDLVLKRLLDQAKAMVESYLRRPISTVARTFEVSNGWGTLHLPLYPVSATGIVVKDVDDATVDAATYRVDPATGMIIADEGEYFDNGPYTVTVPELGLELADDYASTIEPVLSAAILDLASDLYWHRNPNSSSESEAGASVSYAQHGMPPRVVAMLEPYRRVGGRV